MKIFNFELLIINCLNKIKIVFLIIIAYINVKKYERK